MHRQEFGKAIDLAFADKPLARPRAPDLQALGGGGTPGEKAGGFRNCLGLAMPIRANQRLGLAHPPIALVTESLRLIHAALWIRSVLPGNPSCVDHTGAVASVALLEQAGWPARAELPVSPAARAFLLARAWNAHVSAMSKLRLHSTAQMASRISRPTAAPIQKPPW